MGNLDRNKTVAVVLAGGIGSRMGGDVTKQKMMLGTLTVLQRTLKAFDSSSLTDCICVVCRPEEMQELTEQARKVTEKVVCFVNGGKNRAESAKNGYQACIDFAKTVVIHDACRSLVTPLEIDLVIKEAQACGAASAVVPIFDTVKTVDENGNICGTVDRTALRGASTPQAFSAELYGRALSAIDDLCTVTDDNMLIERLGVGVRAVEVSRENIKITTPSDIRYAEFILSERGELNV